MNTLIIRELGLQEYVPVWQNMQAFTDQRDQATTDEIWVVEHPPVFTQGQAGKAEHILAAGDIPVVQVDRGGQVTYHGPGQLVIYFLIDIRRRKTGVRHLVSSIEEAIIRMLKEYHIESAARPDAPGVYIGQDKVCSLGLRIRKGSSFHGLALNVNMDLEPFHRINPCGYKGLEMTQTSTHQGPQTVEEAAPSVIQHFSDLLGYTELLKQVGFDKNYVQAS